MRNHAVPRAPVVGRVGSDAAGIPSKRRGMLYGHIPEVLRTR